MSHCGGLAKSALETGPWYRGGGLYRVEFLCHKLWVNFLCGIHLVFLRSCTGIHWAVLLPMLYHAKGFGQ